MASEMKQNESFERVYHGLRSAASAARQLGVIFKSNAYLEMARQFDQMAFSAKELYDQAALTHAEACAMLDRMQARHLIAAGETIQ